MLGVSPEALQVTIIRARMLDGVLKVLCDQIVNQKIPVSKLREVRLPWRPDISNIVVIKLPVTTAFTLYGETRLSLDISRIDEYLTLAEEAKDRLAMFLEIPRKIYIKAPKNRLDYPKLSSEYQNMSNNGGFKSRAELARHLGVSRTWVTKVMKHRPNH